jgi:lipopolysaccharide exporter
MLLGGSGSGQLLAILLSPLITRLFTPEELTASEQFTMLFNILAVVVTGKYEFAVMAPKSDHDARHLVRLSLRLAAIGSLVLGVLCIMWGDVFARWLNSPELGEWIWLLPLSVFGFALFNVFNYWFSRQKNYRVAGFSKAVYSLAGEPSKVLMGWAGLGTFGLLAGITIGHLAAGWYIVSRFIRSVPARFADLSDRRERELAREYIDFPKYTIWGSIFNRTAQWAHVGLFSAFYGLEVVAFMALSRRIFMTPLNVLSNSFSQVFYQRIHDIDDALRLRAFYWKMFRYFMLAAAGLIGVVWLIPASLVEWVFGSGWGETMHYLRILCFWFAFNFVSSSLSFISYRLNLQRFTFVMDLLHLLLMLASVQGAWMAGMDAYQAVIALSATKVIYLSIYFALIGVYLNRHVRSQRKAAGN